MNEFKPHEGFWFVLGVILYAIPAIIVALLIASPVILALLAIFIGIGKA